jgi:hypothetical protein
MPSAGLMGAARRHRRRRIVGSIGRGAVHDEIAVTGEMAETHPDLSGGRRMEAVQIEVVGLVHVTEVQDVSLDGKCRCRGTRRVARVDDGDDTRRRGGTVGDRDLRHCLRLAQLEPGRGAEWR